MKKLLIILGATFFIGAGCGGNQKDSVASYEAAPAVAMDKTTSAATEEARQVEQNLPIERKIIRNAVLRFKADNMEETREKMAQAVKATGGYILNENSNNSEYMREQYLDIRIPAAKLDSFIALVEATAKDFDTKSVTSTDVSEEYIDISARLKTKKVLEARYLEILKQANKVEDMLNVEAQLAAVRGEIESIEGRVKFIDQQVAYSMVNLSYYKLLRGPVGFFGRLGDGFVDGWRSLLEFMLGLVRAWPFVIMFALIVWWLVSRFRRRRSQ